MTTAMQAHRDPASEVQFLGAPSTEGVDANASDEVRILPLDDSPF